MAADTKKIKITLVKSPISQKPALRKTASALGLRKMHASVIQEARPEILGMVRRIAHMVRVEEAKS
jgi:large subunit ribosomal protein L30